MLQRRRNVGARPGTEHQHVSNVSLNTMYGHCRSFLVIDRRHRLVKDVVHLDDGVLTFLRHR